MNNTFKIILSAFTLCLFSCNENLPDHDASIETPHVEAKKDSTKEATKLAIPDSAIRVASAGGDATTQTATAAGMNPAHGQPGHRCDIEVGAPLNSPPTKKTDAAVQQQITPTAAVTPVTKTAPGMNPPHGQPGHRCDIAVGAPLNSAPPKASNTTTTTPVSPTQIAKPAETENKKPVEEIKPVLADPTPQTATPVKKEE